MSVLVQICRIFSEHLPSDKLCSDITLPGTKNGRINFIKHVSPKVFNHIYHKTVALNQPVFQDEYFISRSCTFLLLSPENTCRICIKKTIKYKTEVNFKKDSLTKPVHLNAPAKFTLPDKI